MGLDQGIRRLSRENAVLMAEWQERNDPDEDYPFPYSDIEHLWTGRKENHIHAYFEKWLDMEISNTRYHEITKEAVLLLVDALDAVNTDHMKAHRLLPTQEGFFFGSTEYGTWYFEDIEHELAVFEEILENWDETKVYYYWAWW